MSNHSKIRTSNSSYLRYKIITDMWSNCCGAESSYLSDEICGECLEHATFDDEDQE